MGTGAVTTAKLGSKAVTAAKLDIAGLGRVNGSVTSLSTSSTSYADIGSITINVIDGVLDIDLWAYCPDATQVRFVLSGANSGTYDDYSISGSNIRAGAHKNLTGLNNGNTTITMQGRRTVAGSSVTIFASISAKNY